MQLAWVVPLAAACGGHVERADQPPPSISAGAGGGAGSNGVAGATSGAAPVTEGPGCPDDSWNGSCPELLVVELDFSGSASPSMGVWAEPLQLPSFDGVPGPNIEVPVAKDPANWDRSEVPEGACVFRLHGAPRACLSPRASMHVGECFGEGPRVKPASFYEYEHCSAGISPGCPSTNPWLGTKEGYSWYFRPVASDDEVNVVLCAGECKALLGGKACLSSRLD